MTAKEYLQNAYKIERRVKIIENKVKKLRSQLEYAGISYENTGASHGSCNGDKMSSTIERIAEYERRQQELALILIDKRLQIEKSIDAVADADQREVLGRRYLFYQRWVGKFNKENGEYIMGITDYMNYSERTIYKIHGEALKHIVVPKECSEMQ